MSLLSTAAAAAASHESAIFNFISKANAKLSDVKRLAIARLETGYLSP